MAISTIPQAALASGVPSASNITTGTLPSAQLPTGSVLQVVNVAFTNYTNTNSTTFVDMAGATASITPKFSNSKIFIMITLMGLTRNSGTGNNGACASFQVVRTGWSASWDNFNTYTGSNALTYSGTSSFNYLDSPATTSAVSYKIQWGNNAGATLQINNYNSIVGSSTSTITLMEIAG